MVAFPSYKGRYQRRIEDTATFGIGAERFTITAYGLVNLRNSLYELRESIDYAIKDVEEEIEHGDRIGG